MLGEPMCECTPNITRCQGDNVTHLPVMLTSIEELNLENTLIDTLDPELLSSYYRLTVILAARNRISKLTRTTFSNLTLLRVLQMNSHPITQIEPGIFDRLTALERLTLTRKNFRSFPANIFAALSHLQYLELSYLSLLEDLPPSVLAPLTSLEHLRIVTALHIERDLSMKDFSRVLPSLTNLSVICRSRTG